MKDIKELENRLTKLEQNQFTLEDRECLRELRVKVGVFWNIIEKEAPRLLRQHLTPHLDALLAKAEGGISRLSKDEKKELKQLVDEQYRKELEKENLNDPGRALILALYRGVLEVEAEEDEEADKEKS